MLPPPQKKNHYETFILFFQLTTQNRTHDNAFAVDSN